MKKIVHILLLMVFIISFSSCAGYKPIFNSPDLNFEISKHEVTGDKILGNQIYYKLVYLSKSDSDKSRNKNKYSFKINVTKNKEANVKSSSGTILYYKINLNTNIVVKDLGLDEEILDENFNLSSTFKVKDQYSETIKVENKIIQDLINKTYENFIIKLARQIL
jgi:hypothetical protein